MKTSLLGYANKKKIIYDMSQRCLVQVGIVNLDLIVPPGIARGNRKQQHN